MSSHLVMDVIALVKEGLHSVAEQAVSYKFGQTVLRHIDKALWVVEKCARWAVPPPLEPEDRPQPELVRPLPWVFFLMLLVTLRITRESISLVNLVLGKPPLRSADVVTYIQGKRRYLRTLKYQGNRMMRARTGAAREPWFTGLRSLFEFTMCFRRQSIQYGNNNTTRVSNNDEVLVVKRRSRGREGEGAASMERLIEKMMVDLDAASDGDSSYTLTNATSMKSDTSHDTTESEEETTVQNDVSKSELNDTEQKHNQTPNNESNSKVEANNQTPTKNESKTTPQTNTQTPTKNEPSTSNQEKTPEAKKTQNDKTNSNETQEKKVLSEPVQQKKAEKNSPKAASQAFLQNEKCTPANQTPKKEQKIANGRTVKSTSDRNLGSRAERRETDIAVTRAASADFSSGGKKEQHRQIP